MVAHPADVQHHVKQSCDFDRLVNHDDIGSDRTFQRDREVAEWCQQHEVEGDEYRQTGVSLVSKVETHGLAGGGNE